MHDHDIDWGTGGWGDRGWTSDNDLPPPLERVSTSASSQNNEGQDPSDRSLPRPRPRYATLSSPDGRHQLNILMFHSVDFDYREPTLPYGDPSDDEDSGNTAPQSSTGDNNAGPVTRSEGGWWS